MPISSTTNRVSYQGDGTSAVFAFPYRFHAHSDLGVYVYNSSVGGGTITQLTLNAAGALGFTVSATANASNIYPNGGSVIFNSTPNSQSVVTVYRDTGATNDFSVGQNGAIPSTGLTNSIDRLTIIAQRLKDLATRAIRLPDGFYPAVDLTLPAILQPEQTIILNSTATGLAVGPTSGQVATAQSSALAAAASQTAAAASAVSASSSAVSVGNNLVLVNSAVTSIGNAVSLIGSTAYWGAEAQSSALSATNQAVLAGSSSLSASNQAVLAGSAALSASNSAASASSSALSANNAALNIAVLQASGDLIVGSGVGSAARLPLGSALQVLTVTSGTPSAAWATPTSPTVQIFNSGAGTYTKTPNVRYIKIRMVGGGGGGGGSGTAGTAGTGGTGTSTVFGTLIARGGGGGPQGGGAAGGDGGSATVGTGFFSILALEGGMGMGGGALDAATNAYGWGGMGGNNLFGGAGAGGAAATPGQPAKPNTGGGGGGASANSGGQRNCGGGGGAGGYVEAFAYIPSNTYSYYVADKGSAGTAGTSGNAGGPGATGIIIVEEYY